MIKFYIDDESKLSECEIKGTARKIAAEVLAIVDYVYHVIEDKNSRAGDEFKKLILEFINICFDNFDDNDENDNGEKEKKLEEMLNELDNCKELVDKCLKELKDKKNEVIN